jgi:hypothetical protein
MANASLIGRKCRDDRFIYVDYKIFIREREVCEGYKYPGETCTEELGFPKSREGPGEIRRL